MPRRFNCFAAFNQSLLGSPETFTDDRVARRAPVPKPRKGGQRQKEHTVYFIANTPKACGLGTTRENPASFSRITTPLVTRAPEALFGSPM